MKLSITHFPLTFYSSGPNMFLVTLHSNTLSLCSSPMFVIKWDSDNLHEPQNPMSV